MPQEGLSTQARVGDAEARKQLVDIAGLRIARVAMGLPAPSLFAYARMLRRMSTSGVQSLAADGVSIEMLAVINQTWSALFSQRPERAMRFSVLISTVPLS